jgi:hypothetical protein
VELKAFTFASSALVRATIAWVNSRDEIFLAASSVASSATGLK